jgi:hypothetical protein
MSALPPPPPAEAPWSAPDPSWPPPAPDWGTAPPAPPHGFGPPTGPPAGAAPTVPAHGFGPPTGPPAGAHPPGWVPPPPSKPKKAWAPILAGAAYIAFRIVMFVVNVSLEDDEPSSNTAGVYDLPAPQDGVVLENQLDQVGSCYTTAQEPVPCEVPHEGEFVTSVVLEPGFTDDEAFFQCLEAVTAEYGPPSEGIDVVAWPTGELDSAGAQVADCAVEAQPGGPPMTGSVVVGSA